MKAALTANFVQAVKADGGVQVDVYDTRTRGFLLRVSAAGVKSWCIFYRHHRRNRRLTIGRYPDLSLADARKLAHKHLRDVAHGADPAGDKHESRVADTFGELAAQYLEEHAKKQKRTWKEDERILDKDLLPAWKNRKAADIDRRDVKALLDTIVERGSPIAANRTLALMSTIFNYGVEEEVVQVNPAYRLKHPGEEHERERVLRDNEICALWKVLESEPLAIAAVFKLGLLLAQRRGEILGMAWNELDLQAGWWELPAERVKNKSAHRVPLVGEALSLLRELRARRVGDSPWVFPGPRRRPIANPQKWIARIRESCGFEFHYHDLRRSAASGIASLRIPRLIISKLLNHKERGITRVYDRYSYGRELRAALVKWDRHLVEILAGAPATSDLVALRA
jgi:integrase